MDKEETRNQPMAPQPAGSPGPQPAGQPQQPAYGMPAPAASPAAADVPAADTPAPAGPAAPEPPVQATPAAVEEDEPAPAPAAPSAPAEGDAPAASPAADVPAADTPKPAGPAATEVPVQAAPAAVAEDEPAPAPAAPSAPAEEDASAAPDEPGAASEPVEPAAPGAPAEPDEPSEPGAPDAGKALDDVDALEDLDELDELDDLADLDELDERYIWDARRQRLYEKKPPKERKPRSLFQWLAIGGCGLILLLSVAGWFRNGQLLLPVAQTAPAQSENQTVTQEAAPQQALEPEVAAAQEETEAAFVPTSILVEGEPIGTLASQEAAYSLLEDVKNYYGALAQEDSPGELTVEVLEEVAFAAAGPDVTTDGYESLYQQLTQGEGSPITVRCTVVSKAVETLPYDTQEEKDKYLLEGTRIVEQMGREGASLTVTYSVYDNGRKRTSLSDTQEETIQPQARVVRIGTQKPDADAEPDADTGRKGPDTQLSFQAPVAEGEISRYFGQDQGAMHLGLDYPVGEEGQLTVLASCGGTVVSVMQRGGYGLVVEIDHGDGFLTRYAKLTSAQVALGQQVEAGQAIGLIQQAEGQEDAYLHFELRAGGEAFNPCFYLD